MGIVTSWSVSRYEAYSLCPLKFKLERIDKLCPLCHAGTLVGFEDPTCGSCGGKPGVPDAIARGSVLHKKCEDFIKGQGTLPKELANVAPLLKELRAARSKNPQVVRIEHDFVFQKGWVPTGKFTKGAWLRAKADVLHVKPAVLEIIDWKAGGIDKKTKEIRYSIDKYSDSLEIYSIVGLTVFPAMGSACPRLVFLDAPAGRNEMPGDTVPRASLVKLQKKWEKKILPMFNDTRFSPRPNEMCRFCEHSKDSGGPCLY